MQAMKVIINADDFGMNRKVNDAIVDLLERKKITSATLLANSPLIEEACAATKRFPLCSFGVHLNVTEFKPLSGAPGLEPLLDVEGHFIMNKVREVRMGSSLKDAIYSEFCSQVELIRGLGVHVSHFDSHNYVTTLPQIFPILKKVQKKFQVRRVRITRNIYSYDEPAGLVLRIKKHLYNFMLRHYFHTKTTAGFSGFDLFHRIGIVKKLNHKSFEVVVHPGNDYYALEEIKTLELPWHDELMFPVELVNYYQL